MAFLRIVLYRTVPLIVLPFVGLSLQLKSTRAKLTRLKTRSRANSIEEVLPSTLRVLFSRGSGGIRIFCTHGAYLREVLARDRTWRSKRVHVCIVALVARGSAAVKQ